MQIAVLIIICVIVTVVSSVFKKGPSRQAQGRVNRPEEPEKDAFDSIHGDRGRVTPPTPITSYAPTRHTVTPSTRTGHAHMETSMSMSENMVCPPVGRVEVVTVPLQTYSMLDLNEAAKAIVFGEVLAKPKALRR